MIEQFACLVFNVLIPVALFITMWGCLLLLTLSHYKTRKLMADNVAELSSMKSFGINEHKNLRQRLDALERPAVDETLKNIAKVMAKKARRKK